MTTARTEPAVVVRRRPKDRKAQIARASAESFSALGYHAVSMEAIAAKVGISAPALYRHYANRDGLLNTLADAGFVKLTAQLAGLRLTGRIDRQLLKILDVFLDLAFDNPRLFELMFLTKREGARQYPEDFRARRSPTANVSADVIARAMETGYLNKDDVWEIVFETGALMQGLIMLYLGGRMATSPSEFRAFCHRSFGRYLNGILT